MSGLVSAPWVVDIGRSGREAFFMFWETLWPLVLGFSVSGVVQASGSRATLQRLLGTHRPGAIARASAFGMASSSCSYAAAAIAKSLVAAGADFVAAMVFMIASTNLVIELGVVLVVLVGWQFAAAEFMGGVVMIVLFTALGTLWLRGRHVVAARAHLDGSRGGHDHGHTLHAGSDEASVTSPMRASQRWTDASLFALADLTMLRGELLVGYVVAGLLTTVVPVRVWSVVFLHGHGAWSTLENVVVGPLIAIASFVCSVGNVPLAAALWRGGLSFGGVIAFIFADLITLPLLLIYRQYYGTRMMLRLLGVLWLCMAAAGLVCAEVLGVIGVVPRAHVGALAPQTLQWNYTTFLNIVALVVLAGLVGVSRQSRPRGAAVVFARDPVCGMRVEMAHAPASTRDGSRLVFFCSDRCRDDYLRDHAVGASASAPPE